MAKKTLKAHLVKETSIKEELNSLFSNIAESNIDSDNLTINNVCLFGRRESSNGRTYSDTAIESIAKLSEGGKCFINHITKQEMKDRSGVRDLRDWAGVFEASRRDGEKVFANLKVREAYWDLVKDIALMSPKGIGHSIDARIKVFQDDSGKESVVDVVALRSTDLVASAATTDNLFESAISDNKNNDEDSAAEQFIKDSAKYEVDHKIASLNIKEGMLKDQEIKRSINRLTYDAEDLIGSVMRDRERSVAEKKTAITGILNDLETEIKGLLAELSGSESKGDSKKMELTEIMQDNNLWNQIIEKVEEAKEYTNLKTDKQTLEAKVSELEEKASAFESEKAEWAKEKEELTNKNKEMATKIDAIEAAKAIAEKRSTVDKLIAEAQLPKEVVTDLWVEDLMSLQEKKNGDETVTVESQIKRRIEERKKLAVKSGKVTGSGDEFDDSLESEDGKKPKKTTEEALESFCKTIKR